LGFGAIPHHNMYMFVYYIGDAPRS